MTVHDFVASFTVGQTKRIPANCTAHDLIAYGRSRFNYKLIQQGDSLKRVCPCCNR